MNIAAIIGAVAFTPSIALNIALALGAPLGMYAMSGRHRVIPKEIRRAFIVPIIMQFVAMYVLLTAGRVLPNVVNDILPGIITTILAFFFSLYLTFYMATVLFSVSHKEKTVMGFFAIVSAICFWATAFGTLSYE
ncbi:MAG: hypothetical protein MJZ26_14310 [Fibrobacter sp.]|nr:hypothetical protein [Fibrobacter sp.]